MPSLFDYLERTFTGPIMMQKDFHLKVLIPNIRRIAKECQIVYDPAAPVEHHLQCYDLKTRRPRGIYVDLYRRVCDEMSGLGVEI